jgi:hypothetical protein
MLGIATQGMGGRGVEDLIGDLSLFAPLGQPFQQNHLVLEARLPGYCLQTKQAITDGEIEHFVRKKIVPVAQEHHANPVIRQERDQGAEPINMAAMLHLPVPAIGSDKPATVLGPIDRKNFSRASAKFFCK